MVDAAPTIRITGTVGDMPVALRVEGLDLAIPGAVAGLLGEYVRLETTRDRSRLARRVVQVVDAIKTAMGRR